MVSPLVSILMAALPCREVPHVEPDPDLAAVYLEVGEQELHAHAFSSAAEALTLALAYEPTSARAAALRREACAALDESALDDVRTLMDARRWRDALDALARLSSAPPTARAMLEGTCAFELGDDARAAHALDTAATDPRFEADARVLLALLALRHGAARSAEAQLLTLERQGITLGGPLAGLLRQTGRAGALTFRGAVFAGVDTNPGFAPGVFLKAAQTDGLVGATVLGQWTPWGPVSPYLRVAASDREFFRNPSLRTNTGIATGGFQAGWGGDRVALDYSVEGSLFGTAPYSVAHGPRLEGSLQLDRLILSADWALRFETFLEGTAREFSGARHDASAAASVLLPWGLTIDAAWGLTRDEAQSTVLAFFEHGPRLSLGWAKERTRLLVSGALDWRTFDAFDPDLGVQRSDVRGRGSLRLEVDLGTRLALFASVDGWVVHSNVEAVSSMRLSLMAGALLFAGAW